MASFGAGQKSAGQATGKARWAGSEGEKGQTRPQGKGGPREDEPECSSVSHPLRAFPLRPESEPHVAQKLKEPNKEMNSSWRRDQPLPRAEKGNQRIPDCAGGSGKSNSNLAKLTLWYTATTS